MRELFSILEILKSSTPMEYCEEFNGIKGILDYCNKHVKPFNKLQFRGGNESFLNELIKRLQEYLVECNLLCTEKKTPLPDSDDKLRKILMFLILNTDTTYKYNLSDDKNLVHVLEICPLMPQFLLVTLIWNLHLDKLFYEMLSYAPSWFSFQYYEPATDLLKYVEDPFDVLEKVHQLLKAIYISITRSEKKQMNAVDKKIIYGKLNDYAMNLLRLFYTPDTNKFHNFSKKQYYKYMGFVLKHLLQLVLYTFDVYEQSKLADPTEEALEIFNICLEKKINDSNIEESKLLKEQQSKIIIALLNALQNNVMMINVDIFIYWVEVDLNEKENLQMVIGAMAHRVGERIVENEMFNHSVALQLKSISIRPKTMEETMREATIGDILNAIDNKKIPYHIKKAWFDELLSRPIALGNAECLESIKQNVKLISVDNCQQILDFIKIEILRNNPNNDLSTCKIEKEIDIPMEMEIDKEDYDELIKLVLQCIHNFSVSQMLSLLTYQGKLFGFNTTLFLQSGTLQRATEFFNKYNIASHAFDYRKFLTITFEHPQFVWQKFFDCACHNKVHTSNYCSAVKLSMPFSNNYYLNHLKDVLGKPDQMQRRFLPNILRELYFEIYYPDRKTEFLKQIIHKYVNSYLDSKQFGCVLPLMRTLNLIGDFGETQSHKPLCFGEITAPVLLMAAQIMDKSRWDLITYTDVRDELVRECIQFIQQTSKKFLPNATEKDRKWITKVIKESYKPLTQFYFQKYSLTKEEVPVEFDQFLARHDAQDKSETEMFLTNYVRCTMKETEWLARSERLLPHISDVMLILSGIINETENFNSINNYRHCLANYANIVLKFLIPQMKNDNKKIEKFLMKLLKIITVTPASIYEETLLRFEPLLMNTMKKCSQPMEESFIKGIRNSVEQMKDCRGKHILLNKFEVLISEINH